VAYRCRLPGCRRACLQLQPVVSPPPLMSSAVALVLLSIPRLPSFVTWDKMS
jgi:hypothetical protein